MAPEWMLLSVIAATAVTMLVVLTGFWLAIVRPYLDRKTAEIVEAAEKIEPGVKRGVREGVEETLRDLPENTVKESSRQFRRFGTGLLENGLSSFLGETSSTARNERRE